MAKFIIYSILILLLISGLFTLFTINELLIYNINDGIKYRYESINLTIPISRNFLISVYKSSHHNGKYGFFVNTISFIGNRPGLKTPSQVDPMDWLIVEGYGRFILWNKSDAPLDPVDSNFGTSSYVLEVIPSKIADRYGYYHARIESRIGSEVLVYIGDTYDTVSFSIYINGDLGGSSNGEIIAWPYIRYTYLKSNKEFETVSYNEIRYRNESNHYPKYTLGNVTINGAHIIINRSNCMKWHKLEISAKIDHDNLLSLSIGVYILTTKNTFRVYFDYATFIIDLAFIKEIEIPMGKLKHYIYLPDSRSLYRPQVLYTTETSLNGVIYSEYFSSIDYYIKLTNFSIGIAGFIHGSSGEYPIFIVQFELLGYKIMHLVNGDIIEIKHKPDHVILCVNYADIPVIYREFIFDYIRGPSIDKLRSTIDYFPNFFILSKIYFSRHNNSLIDSINCQFRFNVPGSFNQAFSIDFIILVVTMDEYNGLLHRKALNVSLIINP